MALPFRTPPVTGLSGPLRTGIAAGASPSAVTAGPSSRGTLVEVAVGAGAPVVMPRSSVATWSVAAMLRAGADFVVSAGEGLGCAAVGLLAVGLLAGVCGFERGWGCVLAAVVFGAAFAGAPLGGAGLCVAAGAAGCDILASMVWSRK